MLDPARRPLAAFLFLAIAALIAVDIAADYRSGTRVGHVLTEGVVMVMSLAGAVSLWRQLRSARLEAAHLSVDLEAARREAARFRDEAHAALQGLGEAIDRQFARWELTLVRSFRRSSSNCCCRRHSARRPCGATRATASTDEPAVELATLE